LDITCKKESQNIQSGNLGVKSKASLPIYLDMLNKFAVQVSKDKIFSKMEDCLITATCFVMQWQISWAVKGKVTIEITLMELIPLCPRNN